MAFRTLVALTLGIGTIGFASTNNPVTFQVNEPVSIAGVPPVTLGPGSYVLRTVDSSTGGTVVQILSKRQDYVYTTVLTIPAARPHADDQRNFSFRRLRRGFRRRCTTGFRRGKRSGASSSIPSGWPAFELERAAEAAPVSGCDRAASSGGESWRIRTL